jgi:hypothetical protein
MFLHKPPAFMLMEIIKTCILMIYFRTFWQKTQYALGKTSGKANIEKTSRTRIKTKCGRFKISYQKNY